MYALLEVSIIWGAMFLNAGTMLTLRAYHISPITMAGILTINLMRACCILFHKQNSENCFSALSDLRCRVAYNPTTISPIESPSKQKISMQKHCSTLKFMWKEIETKLLDTF